MIKEIDIARYKSYLDEYLYRFHNVGNLKNPFHCLSPSHPDNHPSMYYSKKYNICKCFACGVRYDIFDLIKLDYGIDNFKEQFNKLAELFNESEKIINTDVIVNMDYEEKNYSKYFDYCFKNISNTSYLTTTRGIDSELQIKYRIGYDEERQLVVFPINDNSYFARSIIVKGKYKSKGTSYLFNEDLIKYSDSNDIIYLTESIIDALSLETVCPDLKVVSLNGTTNIKRLLNLSRDYNFKGMYVIALDNDSVGKTTSELLKKELDDLDITSFINPLIRSIDDGKYKDINEALVNNKSKLKSNMDYFTEQYKIIQEKIKLRSDNGYEIS